MRTICVENLKGGVAKTVSAVNMAWLLAAAHQKRVLLIDCDKQGNASKFFDVHGYENPGLAELLTSGKYSLTDVAQWDTIRTVEIIPANMTLLKADREILMDCTRPQQTRLRKALNPVRDLYDYCIIDCAPDLSMSVINALVAADDLLIPVKLDKFALDGLDLILEQLDAIREFNPNLARVAAFATQYQRNLVNQQAYGLLSAMGLRSGFSVFQTVIRKTCRVDESTFAGIPLVKYAPKSTAAQDYRALVSEYLRLTGEVE